MRWIDANALSEKLCETTIFIKDGEVFQRMINDAPSADAVEVVRCKDCKHWYADADTGMACEFTNMGQPADGYCNWGERKGGDSE